MTPRLPIMRAKRGFRHERIWWLLSDTGNCPPAGLFAEFRNHQRAAYDRMLAILDYTDRKGPPPYPSQYNALGKGLVEFKVSKPAILRVYAMTVNGGWLITNAADSKNTQAKDIARARKRITEVNTRGCDFD